MVWAHCLGKKQMVTFGVVDDYVYHMKWVRYHLYRHFSLFARMVTEPETLEHTLADAIKRLA